MARRTRRTRFITWCKRDPDDERKINYTFKHANGHVSHLQVKMNYLFMNFLKYRIHG